MWTLVGLNVKINQEINNVRNLTSALVHECIAIQKDVIRRYTSSIIKELNTTYSNEFGAMATQTNMS